MVASATASDERKTWIYAFVILLVVSLWMLLTRLSNSPFLALDFEVIIVYLPTALAGIIALYVAIRSKRGT